MQIRIRRRGTGAPEVIATVLDNRRTWWSQKEKRQQAHKQAWHISLQEVSTKHEDGMAKNMDEVRRDAQVNGGGSEVMWQPPPTFLNSLDSLASFTKEDWMKEIRKAVAIPQLY